MSVLILLHSPSTNFFVIGTNRNTSCNCVIASIRVWIFVSFVLCHHHHRPWSYGWVNWFLFNSRHDVSWFSFLYHRTVLTTRARLEILVRNCNSQSSRPLQLKSTSPYWCDIGSSNRAPGMPRRKYYTGTKHYSIIIIWSRMCRYRYVTLSDTGDYTMHTVV